MFIDTHAHLDDERFSKDLENVIVEIKKQKIEKVINPAINTESIEKTLKLKKQYPDFIEVALGYHPHDAKDFDKVFLLESLEKEKVIAIGEVGLDYHYNFSEPKVQKKVFREQLEIAFEKKLPVIIHIREAFEDAFEILKDFSDLKIILHCFSGGVKEFFKAKEILKNVKFGIGGVVTFKKAEILRKVVEEMDYEDILLETDSPYLAPVPYRGKRNTPAFIPIIFEKIAQIKSDIEANVLKQIIYSNTKTFLELD